ncbi:Adaptive-response sensory-kinase SasA [subsurface metagenome]
MASVSDFGKEYKIGDILKENFDDLIFILNENFECEYINERVHLKKLGYSCLAHKILDNFYYDDLDRGLNFLQNILKAGNAIEQIRIRQKEGYRYYELKGKRFVNDAKKIKILIISRDISKFKEKEEEWFKRESNLRKLAETMPELRFWKLLQTKDEKTSFQKSREMLDSVIDNIPQLIYWKDKKLTYLGCNQNYALVNNIEDPDFIVGKTDENLPWAKANLKLIQENEKRVMKNNQSEEKIESWTLQNGSKAWFDINRVPLHNLEGDIVGILCTYNNITNKVNAEQKIKESENKYRSILENIKEGYFEVDLKGIFMFLNEFFCEMTGYSKEELLGKSYQNMSDEFNKKKMFNFYNQVYKTEVGQRNIQFEFFHKNGQKIIVNSSVYLKYDAKGAKSGFYGMVQDFTEKILLEKKLKHSEERYKLISENAYDLISILNQNLQFEYANEQPCLRVLGYTNKEIIGKSVLAIIHPDDKKIAIKTLVEGLDTGKGVLEVRIKHKNNHWIWIEVKGNTFKDRDGKIKGILIGRDITERKEADKRIKESEEKYRTIFNASPNFVYLTDLKGNILDANQAFLEKTKISLKEAQNKQILEFFAGENLEDLKAQIRELRAGKVIKGLETTAKSTLGEIYDCEINTVPLKENGKISRTISFARDITARKQAEQKLIMSEKKYRHLFESSPFAIWIVDLKGVIIDCNSTMNILLSKYERDDLIGKNFIEVLTLFDRPEYFIPLFKSNFESFIKNEPVKPLEFKMTRADKVEKWINISASKIKLGDETLIQVLIQDITEKKEAALKLEKSEEELKILNRELEKIIFERTKELRESERKYRHLFENSPFSIALLNTKGKIIDINSTTFKLFGFKKEDLIGKNYLKLSQIFPSETKPGLRTLQELDRKRDPMSIVMKPSTVQIFNKDNKLMWVESELSTIKIGDEIMIQVIIQDITNKKIAEEKLKESERILRQQNIELKELDRLKTDFISIAAHDLKTPLISVGGYIDLILLREKDLKDDIKEDLNRALSNVDRLESYINRLLDVMKIDAGKIEIVKKIENIYDIIADCISELEYQISQKKIAINLNIPEDLELEVDRFRITQVFSNILSNAVKFSPNDGIININVLEENQNFLFKIKDNGKGLTLNEIEKLFGKFVTIGQATESYYTFEKGSGLGLYICKGMIEVHGGKIWVESEGRDKGAEISFTLPK